MTGELRCWLRMTGYHLSSDEFTCLADAGMTTGQGVAMRTILLLPMIGLLLMVAGCTTTPREEKVIIHCPACGTELDAIIHKHF